MAINPENISTLRVGQLPPNPFGLTDKIPHEIGTILNQGTVQQLADAIGAYLGMMSGIAFLPISVTDGQTLPTTTSPEWFLAGVGTYNQVGFPNVVCTEELNAIISDGTSWSLGVAIPISFTGIAGVSQIKTVRFSGAGQDYTLPSGATAIKGWINDGAQHLEQVGFESDLNTFSQNGYLVTFKKTITTGNRIYIDYYF